MESYTTTQVADIVALPQRKIISFVERGYVQPSIKDASGAGSKRRWNYHDILRCEITNLLLGVISVDAMRFIATFLCDDRRLVQGEELTIEFSKNGPTAPYSKFERSCNGAVESAAKITVSMNKVRETIDLQRVLPS